MEQVSTDVTLVTSKPNLIQVITEVFRDMDGATDNCHWVLMRNGTFYTFFKKDHPLHRSADGHLEGGDELVGRVLEMSKAASLLDRDDNDCVTVMPFREFGHPVYVVLSCLRQAIGWIMISETDVWAETEQQLAAVGYAARQRYELDCEQNDILATSFPWSCDVDIE